MLAYGIDPSLAALNMDHSSVQTPIVKNMNDTLAGDPVHPGSTNPGVAFQFFFSSYVEP